jgi:hypothetical protein
MPIISISQRRPGGGGGAAVAEQGVAGGALVHDGDLAAVDAAQAGAEQIGPAVVLVAVGPEAVGDGIAEGDDAGGGWGAEHVDAGDVGARLGLGGAGHGGGAGLVAVGDRDGLQRPEMLGDDVGLGDVERDHEVGAAMDRDGDGIADRDGAGGNVQGGLAGEGDRVIGGGVDGAAVGGERDVDVAEGQRAGAVLVGQAQAQAGAAGGDVGDGAQRLVFVLAGRGGVGGVLGGGPGGDPGRRRGGRGDEGEGGGEGGEAGGVHGDMAPIWKMGA